MFVPLPLYWTSATQTAPTGSSPKLLSITKITFTFQKKKRKKIKKIHTHRDTYWDTTSWVEVNRGDHMRNLPNRLVEREFMNESLLKESSSSGLSNSECRRTETLSSSSGSFRVLMFFSDSAISFSTEDFPHKTSAQGELEAIAEQKRNETKHIQKHSFFSSIFIFNSSNLYLT